VVVLVGARRLRRAGGGRGYRPRQIWGRRLRCRPGSPAHSSRGC
jgi:hypothetical protein